MSRTLSTLAATTALALATLTVPTVSAHAAAPFDGTWIIDVPADRMTGDDEGPACPPLRLRVQIADNQVSANFRRSYPEAENVVANGGVNRASLVSGNVQSDGSVTAQWQNFHAAGRFVGDTAALTVQTACGPLLAHGWRLDDETTQTASAEFTTSSGSSSAEDASSTTMSRGGYNVYFAFDRSKLTIRGQEAVNSMVGATQGDHASRIALVGKADLSGTDAYNMALSQRRADRVRDAMVASGVPAGRIDVRWVGEREPPVATAAGAREPLDRVVEVSIQ